MEFINANGQVRGLWKWKLTDTEEEHDRYLRSIIYEWTESKWVNINKTTSMMIGGYFANKIWYTQYYNHTSERLTSGPDLKQSRYMHAAGTINVPVSDSSASKKIVVVTGGFGDRPKVDFTGKFYPNERDSTELLIDNSWHAGKDNSKFV